LFNSNSFATSAAFALLSAVLVYLLILSVGYFTQRLLMKYIVSGSGLSDGNLCWSLAMLSLQWLNMAEWQEGHLA